MTTFAKRTSLAALAGLLLLSPAVEAQQRYYGQFPNTANFINPNPYVAPGLKLNQWAYNTAVVGRAYSQVPPYALGYNPYPTVANYGPVNVPYPTAYTNPYGNPYAGGYGAGAVPAPGVAGGVVDPYAGGYSAGGYNPYTNPYAGYGDPYGGYLRGEADVMRSYGTLQLSLEQARITRELANQARLETKKKSIELQNWIRDNTLTWSQEQERVASQTLRRIQTAATQGEIWSGKAQNILLKDLAKNAKKGAVQPITFDEEVLKQVNVTGSYGNLGILRDNGKFSWPGALRDLAPDKEYADMLKEINLETQVAYRQSVDGKLDGKLVRDLRNRMGKLRDQLVSKVNDIPTSQILEAKRFLNDFDDGITALEKGDVVASIDFRTAFSGPGKSAQELVEYMTRRGLKFAPAVSGDEGAYQALQSALAAYDMALNGGHAAPMVTKD